MMTRIVDQVGCTITGDLSEKELARFKTLGWREVPLDKEDIEARIACSTEQAAALPRGGMNSNHIHNQQMKGGTKDNEMFKHTTGRA